MLPLQTENAQTNPIVLTTCAATSLPNLTLQRTHHARYMCEVGDVLNVDHLPRIPMCARCGLSHSEPSQVACALFTSLATRARARSTAPQHGSPIEPKTR